VDSEGSHSLEFSGIRAAVPNLERIIRGLLYVYIFALPFQNLLFIERNGFIILLVLLVIWCLVYRNHFLTRTAVDLPLLAFVVWVGLTIPFAAFPAYSAKEFAKLLQQVLIFYVIIYFFRADHHRSRLVFAMGAASLVVSGYGIRQFLGTIGVLSVAKPMLMIESVTPGEVWLTTYLVLMVPICLTFAFFEHRRFESWFYRSAAAMGIGCLLLTFSRAGFFALLSELCGLFLWMRRRLLVYITLLCALLVGVIMAYLFHLGVLLIPGTDVSLRGASTTSLVHRLDIWRYTVARIGEHPVVGIGYGKETFKLASGKLPEDSRPLAEQAVGHVPILQAGTHNTFLDLALGVGIPGVLLFGWMMWRIFKTVITEFRVSASKLHQAVALGVGMSIVGLIVRLFFDHMFVGTLAIQFWVLAALGVGISSTRQPGHAAGA
jgi:O-antigen ligase